MWIVIDWKVIRCIKVLEKGNPGPRVIAWRTAQPATPAWTIVKSEKQTFMMLNRWN